MSNEIRNAAELRAVLAEVISGIRDETMDTKKAEAISNAAGKMISSAKAQIEYYQMRKERPKIAFLSTRGNSDEAV